ncbi:hypothetical protein FOVSG1_006399 [Fusarium oxysporum f. sp. vasinfectum]
MSSSTCLKELSLDLHHTTKAVVRWREDDTMQFLTKPDPRSSAVTFNTRFNGEAAFFELGVPVKLKGLDIVTNAMVRVCASSIVSLEVVKNPTVPTAIGEAFKSTALSLDFTLKCPPTIIVHTAAVEPLSPSKKSSGVVLDAIRDLSKATALSIYIEARDAPPKLQHISDAASQGLFKSCSTRYHIASLYGGIGGKLIEPSGDTAAPPSYDETTSRPPPPPPPIEFPRKKRPRQDTETERDDITLLWAELRAIKEVQSRVEALETENEKLKQQNKELVEGMDKLQERYDALEHRFAALDSKNEEFADTYDCSFSELREDMDRLEGVVDFVQEGQVREESLEVIKNVVVKEIMTRLANGGACLGPPIEGHHRPCQRRNSPCTRVASAVADGPQDERLIASPPAPFTSTSLIALIAIGIVPNPSSSCPSRPSDQSALSASTNSQRSSSLRLTPNLDFRKGLTLGDDVKLGD